MKKTFRDSRSYLAITTVAPDLRACAIALDSSGRLRRCERRALSISEYVGTIFPATDAVYAPTLVTCTSNPKPLWPWGRAYSLDDKQ